MEKNELHQKNLNIKHINITIKHLRKTNRPLTENPSSRRPGKKKTVFTPLNSDGTNCYMSGLYTRLYMKNTINMWNRKLIWISQVVFINFLMK